MHKIRKYQNSGQIYPMSNQSMYQSKDDVNWGNLNSILGDTYKKLADYKKLSTPTSPNIGALTQSSMVGSIAPIKIKPIGTALAEDASRVKAIGAASKAASAAKTASAFNTASQLVDPILQIGEGVAKSFGATFAEKDAQSGITDVLATGLNFIPGVGPALGIGVKALDFADRAFGKNVKGFEGNTGTASYSDFSTQGKKFRWSGKKGANQLENKKAANKQFYGKAMGNIGEQNQKSMANINFGNQIGVQNQNVLNNNFNSNTLMGKNGTKLYFANIKNKANNRYKKSILVEPTELLIEDPLKLKEGGLMTNLIPNGELHARKNNYTGDIGEAVTTKGIPVISFDDGGEITQHAEIEMNEIIFNKEVTDKLETMFKEYKDGDEDMAIKAGKLLTYEILQNTQDNTGLLETIEA